MSEIFSKIYLDEDVNVLIAKYVRLQNFNALTVTEAGKRGESDAEQLRFAADNGYAILTHNRVDFEKLARAYFEKAQSHGGIVIAVRRPANEVAAKLLNVLNAFTADEMANQIIYI